jgi:hypothetical protein
VGIWNETCGGPPPCDEPTVHTVGYWKHQFNTCLKIVDREPQESCSDLLIWLDEIDDNPSWAALFGVGDISMEEAADILNVPISYDQKMKALAQFMGVLLNLVSGKVCPEQPVQFRYLDTLMDAIDKIVWLIENGYYKKAKRMSVAINEGIVF